MSREGSLRDFEECAIANFFFKRSMPSCTFATVDPETRDEFGVLPRPPGRRTHQALASYLECRLHCEICERVGKSNFSRFGDPAGWRLHSVD